MQAWQVEALVNRTQLVELENDGLIPMPDYVSNNNRSPFETVIWDNLRYDVVARIRRVLAVKYHTGVAVY